MTTLFRAGWMTLLAATMGCFLPIGPLRAAEAPPSRPRPDRPRMLDRAPLPAGTEAHRDLEFAKIDDISLLLDLYVPKSDDGPLPLIVWIHGGGWKNGSKENWRPVQPLLAEGYAVASINYRLSDVATFPAQIHDCKAAIRWLRAHAKEYGLDPDRFVVAGSSAGGHLAALVGTSGDVKELEGTVGGNNDESSEVQAVVDYFGPADLTMFSSAKGRGADSPPALMLGGPASERPDVAAAASPVTHATKNDPPFLILHGDADPAVPLEQSKRMEAALEKAGVPHELIVIEGAKHGGPEFMTDEIIGRVKAFAAKSLKK